MSVLDQHGAELHQHAKRLDDHDVKIDKIDEKVDVIDSTTKGTASAVGTLIKQKGVKKLEGEVGELGTIQKGDWKGTLAAIVGTMVTVCMTGWSLWAIMYGNSQPFFAYLSIVCQPTIFMMIKTLTGNDIKKNEVMHQLDTKAKEKLHKSEMDNMAGILQMKTMENFGLKEKIARLETKQEMKKEITAPRMPPV